ncbi:hypothetical protein, partial [Jeotgalicoccus psychrophilus]|uniref:hypothetical protein n=1 Tax=Jeotgalicoccus psychrophilus TaxID=157228 RepID=UPI001B7F7D16
NAVVNRERWIHNKMSRTQNIGDTALISLPISPFLNPTSTSRLMFIADCRSYCVSPTFSAKILAYKTSRTEIVDEANFLQQ